MRVIGLQEFDFIYFACVCSWVGVSSAIPLGMCGCVRVCVCQSCCCSSGKTNKAPGVALISYGRRFCGFLRAQCCLMMYDENKQMLFSSGTAMKAFQCSFLEFYFIPPLLLLLFLLLLFFRFKSCNISFLYRVHFLATESSALTLTAAIAIIFCDFFFVLCLFKNCVSLVPYIHKPTFLYFFLKIGKHEWV